ncbi:DUF1102 family protein [Halalkaliarchaeum sp. AArc-CO]|uniref:hypothetical protein n=1 Tax=Halalkaliarchaeum sp. AArc-CO TaxID=2866381 RepID=UPI00217DE035|nr:hypothetical protein [Halalkaliarchaeum sp. AArc-CO]UWG51842.1 DUF1102 family protein [Halalkaliarchaeum sp. AArc-CO]
MKRRHLLAGMGTIAAGSATLVGSGAFTSVEAEREIEVSVVGDDAAFLALEAIDGDPNAEEFVTVDGHTLRVHITENEIGGEGVNEQSAYLFDDLFTITNQGTQGTYVYMDTELAGVNFYRIEGGDRRQIDAGGTANGVDALGDIGPRPEIQYLEVGESIRVGLGIDTIGTPFDRDGTATIIAETDVEKLPSGGGWDREDPE